MLFFPCKNVFLAVKHFYMNVKEAHLERPGGLVPVQQTQQHQVAGTTIELTIIAAAGLRRCVSPLTGEFDNA